MKVVMLVVAVMMLAMLALALCNRWLGIWACRVMGWHLRPKQIGFDGCSANGTCPRCGNHVLQDSQGNWF